VLTGLTVFAGYCMCIVPGIIFLLCFWVPVPVAVIERLGPIASMKRSMALTRGSRWAILGVIILLGVLEDVASRVAGLVLTSDLVRSGVASNGWVGWVETVVFGVWYSTASVVGYYLLRKGKENIDIEEIAAVFA
jgi:hypothetical protein